MSARVATGVRDYVESHDEEEQVTLIVGISGDADTASELIADVGAEVEEALPYDSLAVSADIATLQKICDLDVVSSVELEKEYGTRGDTDFRFQ